MSDNASAKAHIVNVGFDVMSASLDPTTKAVVVQIGDSTNEQVDHDRAEWWQHTGFASMPAAPTQGASSCQGIAIKHSDRDMVLATRDLRGTAIYGNLKPGETCVYAPGAQGRTLYKANGDVVHFTSAGNTPGGQNVAMRLASDGSIALQGLAAMLTIDPEGNITLGNSAGGITISASGTVKIFGTIVQCQASGVAQVAGNVATLLGPNALPVPVTACAVGLTGPVNTVSTNVYVSP